MDAALHALRDADLFRIFGRPSRSDLFGLGDSDPEHPRLERSLIFNDRRALFELLRIAGEGGVGEVRRGGRRGARSALRGVQGAMRVRTDGEHWFADEDRRYLEDEQ